MIKKLRIKFVCVVMLIVTIMLGVILGGVMRFTSSIMEIQSINIMRSIASAPVQLGNLGEIPDEVRLPFFAVQVSPDGNLINATGGYYDLSDREFLQEIINAANASADGETGELKEYNLRYCKVTSLTGQSIIFSDTTTEQTAKYPLCQPICRDLKASVTLVVLAILTLRTLTGRCLPTGGSEMPDIGSIAGQGESTTIDLADAHITVEFDGGKATGSIEDITIGTFLTITLSEDGEAVKVVVSSVSSFGGGFSSLE